MKKTILISGINGFLARNLANLLKDDYTIYGIGKTADSKDRITSFASHQLEAIDFVPDFLVLCHAAVSSGQTSLATQELFDVNVTITQNLISKFPSSKILYISSTSIYDSTSLLIQENSVLHPQSEYAISKLWAELVVFKAEHALVFRLSSLFGIGMKENTIIPNYVNQALKNQVIEVWGTGERKQNYILVADACLYIKKALQNFDALKGKLLLAVHHKEFSNVELAQIIAKETNSKVVHCNEDNSKSLLYSNEITCKLLNWTPQSNFKEEIHKYIQWKREQF